MFKGIIETRVMSVIKEKIKAKEQFYKEGVMKLEAELEGKIEKFADEVVESIIGKIL